METETFNLPLAASISSISPVRFKNGPSNILTTSPIENLTFGTSLPAASRLGVKFFQSHDPQEGWDYPCQ